MLVKCAHARTHTHTLTDGDIRLSSTVAKVWYKSQNIKMSLRITIHIIHTFKYFNLINFCSVFLVLTLTVTIIF
jgi:hypothetical protein